MRVSVIVPCYQAERYLPECLWSLRSQDFQGLELLLIDDGSRDATGAILDQAATEDPRVRVWHTENRGVSAARTLGIERARGDYLLFVDSDDLLLPGAVEKLYQAACAARVDIVSADHEELLADGTVRRVILPPGERSREDILRSLVRLEGLYNNQCNKLIARTLFTEGGIRPVQGVAIGEDVLLNLKLYQKAQGFCHLPEVTYIYRRHSASAMGGATAAFEAHLPMLREMRAWLGAEGLLERYYHDYFYMALWLAQKQWGLRGAMRACGREIVPLLGAVRQSALDARGRRTYRLLKSHLFLPVYGIRHAWRRLRKQPLRQG